MPEPDQDGVRTLCPYCGMVSKSSARCSSCKGYFDPLSRQASQNAMGPWFVLDPACPTRPGCSFETVRELVRRGRIAKSTVVRGPSTRQFWNYACRTPGLANLLGECHNCHAPVEPAMPACPGCGASFALVDDRQHLGLAAVHLLPGQASPEAIVEHSESGIQNA